MIGSRQSVTFCDGHRIFRDNHEITRNRHGKSRNFPWFSPHRPFFCAVSVTAEKKRNEKKKKRENRIAPTASQLRGRMGVQC